MLKSPLLTLCSFLPVNADKSSVVCGFDPRSVTCTILFLDPSNSFHCVYFALPLQYISRGFWDRLEFSSFMSVWVNKKGLCISNSYETWENTNYDDTANCLTEIEWLHPHCLFGTYPGPWCPPNYGWALSERVPGDMGQNRVKEVLSIQGWGWSCVSAWANSLALLNFLV